MKATMYIDDQEMIDTTSSDGAHGGRGYQSFCNEKGVRESLRADDFTRDLVDAIDFTSSFLTVYTHAIYLFQC